MSKPNRAARNKNENADAARAPQRAARHEGRGEENRNPQDETENTTLDTDQHSDAPGPFGTG